MRDEKEKEKDKSTEIMKDKRMNNKRLKDTRLEIRE